MPHSIRYLAFLSFYPPFGGRCTDADLVLLAVNWQGTLAVPFLGVSSATRLQVNEIKGENQAVTANGHREPVKAHHAILNIDTKSFVPENI